ncbi:MAG: hypothetical protein U0133_13375 [Gemmatimonadales bacterium]
MAGIFDKINTELDAFGKRAREALDEGRLQIERFRLARERDEAAKKLGYLFHRRERGTTVDPLEIDAWMVRVDNFDASIAKIDRELSAAKGEVVSVSETPAPAGSETGEATVQESR